MDDEMNELGMRRKARTRNERNEHGKKEERKDDVSSVISAYLVRVKEPLCTQ